MFYPVHGELGSDPCAFLVKLSDTESNFRYKDGFFTDSGCEMHRRATIRNFGPSRKKASTS